MSVRIQPFHESSPFHSDASSLRERAERDGYLLFRRLVPPDAVYALREAALAVAADLGWLDDRAPRAAGISLPGIALGAHDDPRWMSFLARVMGHPALFALKEAPAIRRVLDALFSGSAPSPAGDVCRVVSGDEPSHTTLPHQERFYVKGTGPLWVAWLPLGDCPMSLGPLAVLPESHRAGLLPHRDSGSEPLGVDIDVEQVWHASDLSAGDALFFSGLTVHRALPHQSGRRLRLSVDFRFQSERVE